jgi:methyl-accepting chemotaxis protein
MTKRIGARFFNRRTYVVRKKLQFTLMLVSFGYVILFFAAMGAYLFIPLMMDLDNAEIGSSNALAASLRILYLHERFWPALIFSFLVIASHSIFISHKIAGPLHRYDNVIKTIKEGNLPAPIRIRKRDYLSDEMESINEMLERLREKLGEIQEAQAHLNSSIIKCKDAVGHAANDELAKTIENLAEQSKTLKEKLGYFKMIS